MVFGIDYEVGMLGMYEVFLDEEDIGFVVKLSLEVLGFEVVLVMIDFFGVEF